MKCNRQILYLGLLLGMGAGVLGLASRASAASAYAITATNVTMPAVVGGPANDVGSSKWTVTGIPADGSWIVGCLYAGSSTTAKVPSCTASPGPAQRPISVKAGQTVTGTIYFYPYGSPQPVNAPRTNPAPLAELALGGVLLGLGLRRRVHGWLALTVLALGTLAGLAGISACGGSAYAGTYPFTISAGFQETGTNVIQTVSTTIQVTVL